MSSDKAGQRSVNRDGGRRRPIRCPLVVSRDGFPRKGATQRYDGNPSAVRYCRGSDRGNRPETRGKRHAQRVGSGGKPCDAVGRRLTQGLLQSSGADQTRHRVQPSGNWIETTGRGRRQHGVAASVVGKKVQSTASATACRPVVGQRAQPRRKWRAAVAAIDEGHAANRARIEQRDGKQRGMVASR